MLPLNVSGPFHSVMLSGSGEKLGEVLEHISLSELEIPYASNVTGELVRDAGQIKELLIRQVYSSVRWQQCVEAMIRDGVELFVEIGPGKTLSGFVKKISRQTEAVNIETWEDLKKIEDRRRDMLTGILEGKIAIVTGAGRGIGKAAALSLARAGAVVAVNYNHSADQAQAVVNEIVNNGGRAKAWQCDVSSFDDCGAFFSDVIKEFGRLDILVNNAGVTRDGLLIADD